MLQAGRARVRFPMRSLYFFQFSSPSSCTMALGSTQPLTEMSTRNLPGGKGRPARKADNLTAICEPAVWKMWEPRRLTTLWASTACYKDSFMSWNSSVFDYGPEDRRVYIVSLCHFVQTGSGTHSASYAVDTGGSYVGDKTVGA
jgi:hypothetical protein